MPIEFLQSTFLKEDEGLTSLVHTLMNGQLEDCVPVVVAACTSIWSAVFENPQVQVCYNNFCILNYNLIAIIFEQFEFVIEQFLNFLCCVLHY
jgi:hypothetical protein